MPSVATRTVVFDMDGTLVQSRGAAWEVWQDTIEAFDLPMRHAGEFFDLFRENFFTGLAGYIGDPDRAREVAAHFLGRLRERYTPELIPGMADTVHALAGHCALAVISSNAMTAIRRTLEISGVAQCFAHVFSGDVEADKGVAIRRILDDPTYAFVRRCSPAYVEDGPVPTRPAPAEVVLVTDTVGDVREGVACGIRVLGVAWGMHSVEDLRAAGADFVALWPQEIVAYLLPDGFCRPGGCDCDTSACAVPVRPAAAALPAARDVRAEAVELARQRSSRRTAPAAGTKAGCGCGCDDRSDTKDPYLSVALGMIAAGPP